MHALHVPRQRQQRAAAALAAQQVGCDRGEVVAQGPQRQADLVLELMTSPEGRE
jgi:hypothetical protein